MLLRRPASLVSSAALAALLGACGGDGLKNVSNKPPIAAAGTDAEVIAGQALAFDGSASHDEDGQITSFHWEFGDGQIATGAQASHVYAQAGSFTAKLTVTDDEGASGSDERVVHVGAANLPPMAMIDGRSSAYTKADLQFDGSGSTDPDGHVVAWSWDFGDGQTATGATVTHAYQAAGSYTVKLTATDDGGLSATSDPWTMRIEDPPAPPSISQHSTWTWTGQDSGSFLCASGFGRLTIDIANPSAPTTAITITEASPGGSSVYSGQLNTQTRAFSVTHTMSGLSSGTESISATFSADWKSFSGTYTLNASGCNKTIPVTGTRQ